MDKIGLEGMSVKVGVSDPWEFDPYEFKAVIEYYDEKTGFAIMRATEKIVYRGQECIYFRICPRHRKEQSIKQLCDGVAVSCDSVLIDENFFNKNATNFCENWKYQIGAMVGIKRLS
jgi:hypothetical protein